MLLQVINLAVSTVKLHQKLILKSKLLGRVRLISHVFHIDKFLMKNNSSEIQNFLSDMLQFSHFQKCLQKYFAVILKDYTEK